MAVKEGAFYTGNYRNVLYEAGYSERDIARRVEEAWAHIFEDSDTRFFHEVGSDEGYMVDTGNLDVRTEGQSYGMMMAVQMNRKDVFDRIWKWTKKYMWHQSGKYKDYFAWSCNLDGTRRAQGPAPDGEEYFALALLFASNRWGDDPERFDYSVQAKRILTACVHKGENGEEGDPMWDPQNKLIKFVPETPWTDPSYHLPHFYELFSLWGPAEDRDFWKEAAYASRQYLKRTCHPVTGLAPEYAEYDGTPNFTRGHGNFYSDSYRVACNVGIDYEWFRGDEWEVQEANRIQAFFAGKSLTEYKVYTVDGTEIDQPALHPVGLLATNACASLAADGPHAEEFVKMFWDTPLRTGERRYYDNCLYFFSLLALSGNYRIWRTEIGTTETN